MFDPKNHPSVIKSNVHTNKTTRTNKKDRLNSIGNVTKRDFYLLQG